MHGSLANGRYGVAYQDRTQTLFGQTMGFVAITAAFFALGAYAARNLPHAAWFDIFFADLVVMLLMRFPARHSAASSAILLVVFGLATGVMASALPRHHTALSLRFPPQAGVTTALFLAVLGSISYLTRRNQSRLARASSLVCLALLVSSIAIVLAHIVRPLSYAVLAAVLSGLAAAGFRYRRRSGRMDSAPLIAASFFTVPLNLLFSLVELIKEFDEYSNSPNRNRRSGKP